MQYYEQLASLAKELQNNPPPVATGGSVVSEIADKLLNGAKAAKEELVGTALYPIAKPLADYVGIAEQSDDLWKRVDAAKEGLENINNLPAKDWVPEYVRYGHDLSSAPVKMQDGTTSHGGDLAVDVRYKAGKTMRDSIVPEAKEVWEKLPDWLRGPILRAAEKTGIADTLKPYIEGTDGIIGEISAGGKGPDSFYASSKQHYDAYGHSPAAAYIQMGTETGSTFGEAAKHLAEASLLPESQRNEFLHKQMAFTAEDPKKYDISPAVEEILGKAGIDGKNIPILPKVTQAYKDELAKRQKAIMDTVFHGDSNLSQGEWIKKKVLEAAHIPYKPGVQFNELDQSQLDALKKLSIADLEKATGDVASRFAKLNYGGYMNAVPPDYTRLAALMHFLGDRQRKTAIIQALHDAVDKVKG